MHKNTRTVIITLSVLLFIAGLFLLFFPVVYGFFVDRSISATAKDFLVIQFTPPQRDSEEPEQDSSTEPTAPALREHNELWIAMENYNRTLYTNNQVGLSDREAYITPSFLFADYGLESEIFGVISIPALNLDMPLYLGATSQHLADGAAVLSQTSIPIGGENTNAVIAGHRGWSGASYFRYIPDLEVGDTVTITNLWETLTYEVTGNKIIEPNEVEEILIQPGRDMITLLTCHPYGSGGKQRYLVYCERVL